MRGLHIPTAKTNLESRAVSSVRSSCRIRKRNVHNVPRILPLPCNSWNSSEISTKWNDRYSYHQRWKHVALRLVSSSSSNDVEDTNRDDGNGKDILTAEDVVNYHSVSGDEEEGEGDQQLLEDERPMEDHVHIPQHSQISMDENMEASISKYLKIPESYAISEQDAIEIQKCIRFLEHRVKKKKGSQEDVERGFHDAASVEKLLHILLNNTMASKHDSDSFKEVYVTVQDFNRALTAWRYAAIGLQISPRPSDTASSTERYLHVLSIQRRNACRCLHACESAEKLLRTMEDLAMNGHSNLRPTQYSFESVLGCWSRSSGALNFMLRGEGRALAALRKIPPRSALNSGHDQLAQSPWYNPAILDKYGLMDPASKADELLERLSTMEELDGSEFRISPWVLKQTLIAWVQVKARPRRFSSKGEHQSVEFQHELKIPARAEELLWNIVDMSNDDESQGHGYILTPSLFRAVISSWSHSNHQEGQYHAEAVLTKMGELYETGKISMMPTPDVFNAVIGSWSRRSPLLPFEAPARCVAIVKHMEGISDNKILSETDRDDAKWSKFWVDSKTYQSKRINSDSRPCAIYHPIQHSRITMGAFKSALNCKKLKESEEFFQLADEADSFLKHMIKRSANGREEIAPDGVAYANVATCYGKAISLLSSEMQREDEVLKEAGLAFIGIHDDRTHDKLSSALHRLGPLLKEMEAGYEIHPVDFNLSIDAYTEVLRAFTSVTAFPEYGQQAVQILKTLITLYEDGHRNMSPTSETFGMVIDALLKDASADKIHEASELLKVQERLHYDGNPFCKPNIKLYRSMLSAYANDPEEAASLLKRMTVLHESNVVDELSDQSGSTSLGFNEILELWSEVDDQSEAASWAETMLLKVANNVYKTSSRCSGSTRILRTKNFDAVVKAWLEAGEIHRAEKLLEEMERLSSHPLLHDLKPGHLSFHSVIKGWIDNDLSQAGDRAEALLKRMSENGLVPNMVTYQLVFEALIKSSKGRGKGSMARAESLLKQIDERSKSVSGKKKPLRPNTMLANMILQGWAQSRVDVKGIRAHKLLQWMIDQHDKESHNKFIRPNFKSYTLVMSAGVRTGKYLSPEKKRTNFDIVMQTFEDLAKCDYGLKPGSISFRIMLTACKGLLPAGKEQQHHIGAIFEHCCRVGVVDELIYHTFCETADKETFELIVGLDKQSWRDLPQEWRKKPKDLIEE